MRAVSQFLVADRVFDTTVAATHRVTAGALPRAFRTNDLAASTDSCRPRLFVEEATAAARAGGIDVDLTGAVRSVAFEVVV
jgi:hypothetical protein